MAVIVLLSGVAVAAIGLLGVVAPRQLTHLLATYRILTRLPATVTLRIAFGTLFLLAAPSCRLAYLVRVVGVVEFAAAAVLLGLGSGRLHRFVTWWLERPPSFVRYWCCGALGFGILLVYAAGWPAQAP